MPFSSISRASLSAKYKSGFTIVELLIVVVVIAILAAITIVAYNGVQKRSVEATLQSDLNSAVKAVEMDKVETGAYPASKALAGGGKGLKHMEWTELNYYLSGDNYCVSVRTDKAGARSFYVNSADGNNIKEGRCPGDSSGGGPSGPVTAAECFVTSDVSGGVEIVLYLGGEPYGYASSSKNPDCPFDVVIPAQIDGKDVVAIGDRDSTRNTPNSSFSYRELTSIYIPGTVKTIGYEAFAKNEITSVTLGHGVRDIGGRAFNSAGSIPVISFPSSVVSIGDHAFAGTRLESISLSEGLVSVGYGAFEEHEDPSVTIPSSVQSLGGLSFAANLANFEVTVNSPSISIDDYAFESGSYNEQWNWVLGTTVCRLPSALSVSAEVGCTEIIRI